MMKRFFTVLLWLGALLTTGLVRGQQSPNTVKFRVGYDVNTQTYTAYVVPDYNTPNGNNPDGVERGATAQFTVVVPKDFVISGITDVNGTWDKTPLKLGPGQPNQQVFNTPALDPNLNYYVIGKAATETNYGAFVAGQSIPLFTFRGNGCFGPIQPLPPSSPFIGAADAAFSLNVGNSFYSRSGQPAGGNQNPLEQFVAVTGAPANCLPVVVTTVTAAPDNATIIAGTTPTLPVLANDTNTGGPASTTNVSVTITVPPPAGTTSVNADGTVTFTPPAGFTGVACFTYQICDLTSTTVCATAQACVTVAPQPVVRTVTAAPDNVTIVAGTAVTTPVLANDTNTGSPASVTNVSVTVTVPPPAGSASVNADGSITYTPPTGFTGVACFTYQVCDLTSTTVCATAQVCVTVTPPPVTNVDVSITKTVVGSKIRALNDLVTFAVVVSNLSQNAVTNVVVQDSLATGLQFVSATAPIGTVAGSRLTIPVLAAGASTTLTVTARVTIEGVSFNYARVVSQDQPDVNGINNSDQTCVSVPVNLCTGEGIIATVPATFTGVQWFKDGVLVGTGNSLTFTTAGTYTFTASNSTCPAEGCCPLVIIQQTCCPANVCVPFVIAKTRSRR